MNCISGSRRPPLPPTTQKYFLLFFFPSSHKWRKPLALNAIGHKNINFLKVRVIFPTFSQHSQCLIIILKVLLFLNNETLFEVLFQFFLQCSSCLFWSASINRVSFDCFFNFLTLRMSIFVSNKTLKSRMFLLRGLAVFKWHSHTELVTF